MLAKNVKALCNNLKHETTAGHQIWLMGYQLRKQGYLEGVGAQRREKTDHGEEA